MNRGPFGSTVCAWDIQSRADRFEVSDELNSCAATFRAVQELQLVCHGDFFTFVAGDDRTAEPMCTKSYTFFASLSGLEYRMKLIR